MQNLFKIKTVLLLVTTTIYAGGYKIPETSSNSVALSGANIAHVHGADAAYDNPANMVFMEDKNYAELDLMYIGTSATNYKGAYTSQGATTTGYNINAQEQSFLVPSLHYVSPKIADLNIRLGVSVVVPGGLVREWKAQPAQSTAEKFALEVIEVSPTLAVGITETLSFAGGVRVVHSSGEVKSSSPTTASRKMTGESTDFGYNVALAYKPTKDIDIGITYRSKVNMSLEGNAKLYVGSAKVYDGGASLDVPLPAALNIAAAYTFATQTTVEFVYERTFWSAYDALDFEYVSAISPILVPSFDDPLIRNWKDTNTWRLGVTQKYDSWDVMAGLVYDETPVPEETLGYESPGSNAFSVSLGGRYKINDTLEFGLAALYSMKEDRKVKNASIDGEFTDSNVLLISAGVGYKF